MSTVHRLLIAEDHHLLRCGLRSMLSALGEYEVVGEAKDGREACQLAISLIPDLVLTDLSMPGMNGIDMVATIKRRLPQIRVVVLTVYKAEEYVREALRVGVDGYVLKDASFEELVTALHVVMLGKRHLSADDVYGNVVQSFVNGHDAPAPKSAWETLSARERSVLQLVAEGRTNRQVGLYLNLSPKTIEKYRAHLMEKLGVCNVTGLVLAAIDLGLIAPLQGRQHGEAAPDPVPSDPGAT
ncbi:response regulator transcription factor [Ralstonia solanacearum]|uniref:DNA-binding response regulator n=1 Tax=Ralstonia solanacearum TaxID=305 RepID=A0A5H2PG81_RALSL|nr:response regulator transcription factor [Ralstonia solanacearum]AMP69698.1 two-component system response regulator [Ralstonia solanacearum]AYB60080.1 DNA-binding response regulator [Ralstonia solanacearum]MBB6586884.1 response regulator transcription factor [Ralstonia solanacearum]MCG3576776.1 response regulator transcription factor [Ralstonia solanacearum]MCL9841958.1 response regulator transcription factor [Ralstonia solanacearum]